jgi:tartrate dehydrogenase/decarboxylase/D-malate dehydrogenase
VTQILYLTTSLLGRLLLFRREFDQYINLRPCCLFPGVTSPLANREGEPIDFITVRENTEGEYSSVGGCIFEGTDGETVIQDTVFTRTDVDRVLRYAFELARSRQPRNWRRPPNSTAYLLLCPTGTSA